MIAGGVDGSPFFFGFFERSSGAILLFDDTVRGGGLSSFAPKSNPLKFNEPPIGKK